MKNSSIGQDRRLYVRRFVPVLLAIVGFFAWQAFDQWLHRGDPVRYRSGIGRSVFCDFETTNREAVVMVWATNVTPQGIFYYGTKVTNRFR